MMKILRAERDRDADEAEAGEDRADADAPDLEHDGNAKREQDDPAHAHRPADHRLVEDRPIAVKERESRLHGNEECPEQRRRGQRPCDLHQQVLRPWGQIEENRDHEDRKDDRDEAQWRRQRRQDTFSGIVLGTDGPPLQQSQQRTADEAPERDRQCQDDESQRDLADRDATEIMAPGALQHRPDGDEAPICRLCFHVDDRRS